MTKINRILERAPSLSVVAEGYWMYQEAGTTIHTTLSRHFGGEKRNESRGELYRHPQMGVAGTLEF